jgi:hypothetical protein
MDAPIDLPILPLAFSAKLTANSRSVYYAEIKSAREKLLR